MSRDRYEENCEGCKPVLIDFQTGQRVPDSHPLLMQLRMDFDALSRFEKEAWHRVTCLNSRTPRDMALVRAYLQKATAIAKKML